jgi:hypothetical protein
MLKFHLFAVIGVAVVAMTLGTPGASKAQDAGNNEPAAYPFGNRIFDRWIDNRRERRGRIIQQRVVSPYSFGNPANNGNFPYYPSGTPVVIPSPSQPSFGSWQVIPAYTYGDSGGSRWGRYGNVIINRRKWGDLENRVSYGDLIRW